MRHLTLVALLLLGSACASTPKNRLLYYRVKVRTGESLAEIAQKFDTSWKTILNDNQLRSPDQIKAGMILKVKPGPGGYLAGTESMKRRVARQPSSERPGFWARLFGGDSEAESDADSQRRSGLLFGGGSHDGQLNFVWPLRGRVTSDYGYRWFRKHKGIDIDGRTGDKIVASAGGVVTYAGWQRGYGRLVIIRHGDMQTRYAHLHQITVRPKQQVRQGQYIGQVGATGNASGSHLHFEIRDAQSNALNPMDILPDDALLSSR